MNRILIWLVGSLISAGLLAISPMKISEKQEYRLNKASSRTSWMINDASGMATLTEYFIDPKLGPAYNFKIDYRVNVKLYGKETGSINLPIPEYIFNDEFAHKLQATHPMNLDIYKIDYVGTGTALDADGRSYEQALIVRIYDISEQILPSVKQSMFSPLMSGISIFLKLKPSMLPLGAIELDLKAKLAGISVRIGFDAIPNT